MSSEPDASSRRLKTPQAAAYLGLSESFLNKSRLTGTGPRFIKAGAAVIYDIPDLDAWSEANKVRSTSEAA